MSASDIQNMIADERLATMERLWDAICHDSSEIASPSWHQAILATRKEKLDSKEAKFYTLDQIRTQFL
jgi:hypothetical protein